MKLNNYTNRFLLGLAILLLSPLGLIAQNQFPAPNDKNTNTIIDGGNFLMRRPPNSVLGSNNNWNRGMNIYIRNTNNQTGFPSSNNRAAFGVSGTAQAVNYMYMAHRDGNQGAPGSGNGIYVEPNGSTGIGVVAPGAFFHIRTGVRNLLYTGAVLRFNNTNDGNTFFDKQDTGDFVFRTRNQNDTNYANRMIVHRGGQVEIPTRLAIGATDTQGFKLAVNGKVRAKEVVVETGWSDFVFENDYGLRSLDEVEKYIGENGHLPEIPSAKEVAENGVKLGEMDSKLLMKIEELTLYMIAQQKEIKALKEELKTVKDGQ
ncbi:MAG: hypothetical protein AAFZ89_13710 [Bacteroidota bacterium]